MNEYLHHVPGRMRIRAQMFLSESRERSHALRRLWGIAGVRSLRLNEKAGSVTLYYDTGIVSGEALLNTLRRECPHATVPAVAPGTRRPPRMTTRPIAAEIGKMALGVLVNKGVSYSLASLLRSPL
jgi:hypothetical protein